MLRRHGYPSEVRRALRAVGKLCRALATATAPAAPGVAARSPARDPGTRRRAALGHRSPLDRRRPGSTWLLASPLAPIAASFLVVVAVSLFVGNPYQVGRRDVSRCARGRSPAAAACATARADRRRRGRGSASSPPAHCRARAAARRGRSPERCRSESASSTTPAVTASLLVSSGSPTQRTTMTQANSFAAPSMSDSGSWSTPPLRRAAGAADGGAAAGLAPLALDRRVPRRLPRPRQHLQRLLRARRRLFPHRARPDPHGEPRRRDLGLRRRVRVALQRHRRLSRGPPHPSRPGSRPRRRPPAPGHQRRRGARPRRGAVPDRPPVVPRSHARISTSTGSSSCGRWA